MLKLGRDASWKEHVINGLTFIRIDDSIYAASFLGGD